LAFLASAQVGKVFSMLQVYVYPGWSVPAVTYAYPAVYTYPVYAYPAAAIPVGYAYPGVVF
jgi:hypothetical protein